MEVIGSSTLFIAKYMAVECLAEDSQMVLILKQDVGSRWEVLFMRPKTQS